MTLKFGVVQSQFFLSKEGCYNHKKISEQEFIEITIIFRRETSVSVGGAKNKWMIAKDIKKEFLKNRLNTDLLIRYY